MHILILRSDGDGDVREVWPHACCPPLPACALKLRLVHAGRGYYVVVDKESPVRYETYSLALTAVQAMQEAV